MSHEKRRGNKEAKKPKKEKPKATQTAAPAAGKSQPVIGGKKV